MLLRHPGDRKLPLLHRVLFEVPLDAAGVIRDLFALLQVAVHLHLAEVLAAQESEGLAHKAWVAHNFLMVPVGCGARRECVLARAVPKHACKPRPTHTSTASAFRNTSVARKPFFPLMSARSNLYMRTALSSPSSPYW